MSGPRLSIIPAGAVTDRALEPRDLQVLCLLGRHTDRLGWCVRSQVKMAGEIDCGRSSVQRSLERLVDAGWVEKKRRDAAADTADPGQPSASYAYRVVLDRDDFAFEAATHDGSESHAENASEEGECPPVGTPSETETSSQIAGENTLEGAQQDGHPGAQPYVGTGAQPYVGTKNVPSERPPLERERDARARDRKARFLVAFEARWPTAAADNRQRTAYAAGELSEEEEAGALAGIAPFLENQKRLGRKNVPAGWRYLEEKRWTLLDQPKETGGGRVLYPRGSVEAKAITTLHEIANRMSALRTIWTRSDGSISFQKPMTPQLAALAQAPPQADWATLDRQQAGAWEGLLRQFFEPEIIRAHMREGSRAPWPWPPRKDGTLSTAGPSEGMMTDQDYADLK